MLQEQADSLKASCVEGLSLNLSGWWSDSSVEVGIIPSKSSSFVYFCGVRNLNSKSCENMMLIFALLPSQPTSRHTQRFRQSILWWEKGFPINFPFNPILAPCRIRNPWGKVAVGCCAAFPPFCKVCDKHHSFLMAQSPHSWEHQWPSGLDAEEAKIRLWSPGSVPAPSFL